MFGTLPRKSEGDLPQTSVREAVAARKHVKWQPPQRTLAL